MLNASRARLTSTALLTVLTLFGLHPQTASGSTAAPTVSAMVNVGDYPVGIATTPDGRYVWVADNYVNQPRNGTVSIIDAATRTVSATIAVGREPYGVAISPDGSRAVVTNSYDGTASIIAISTRTVLATVTTGTTPADVAFSPDGSFAWVSNLNGDSLSKIRMSDLLVFPVALPVNSGARGVVVSPDGSTVYVAASGTSKVHAIDSVTDSLRWTVTVGGGPMGLALSADGSHLWVANLYVNTVTRVDTQARSVGVPIAVGGSPWGVGLSPDGSQLWSVNSFGDSMSIIDTVTQTVIDTVTVGDEPYFVAFVPDGSTAWVTVAAENRVAVFGTGSSQPASPDPGQVPVTAAQQFAVSAGTQSKACEELSPDWVNWPALEGQRGLGWTVSYAQWPNDGSGGWVCTRQPVWRGSGWTVP